MGRKKYLKLLWGMAFCSLLFFAACGKEAMPPVNSSGMSQKMDEEGLTDKQKENALSLKGKVYGELPVVGEEDAIYCNLPENILSWESSIPICHDPLYDILYYVNYEDDNKIYAIRNGISEMAVELSGCRLFCRGGKLYFLLNSNTKTAIKGAKDGNILCYNPVDGTVVVVSDSVFDSITVYQDLIYCRKEGKSSSIGTKIDYWFYYFNTRQLVEQEQQKEITYCFDLARYGEYFVTRLFDVYNSSNPREDIKQIIAAGIDPTSIRMQVGTALYRTDGREEKKLEKIIELPRQYYVKDNKIIWMDEDNLHQWDINKEKDDSTKIICEGDFSILLNDILYTTNGYTNLKDDISAKCFVMTDKMNGTELRELYTDGKQIYGVVLNVSKETSQKYQLGRLEIVPKERVISALSSEELKYWGEVLVDYDDIYWFTLIDTKE